ncbi:MAG: tetratricopeptide repeat protein, partial [bacterium]|nr:tetratricopeptide repeat protein [bacterium]
FYGNTLGNGFIHDDHGQIEDNIFIQKLSYLPKVFTGCIWEAALGDCKISSYYRPLQSLSYLLTYQISSSPGFFHFINLVYFIAVVFAAFIVLRKLTGNERLSLIASFLFLIHPLNTETVNWLATVPELLYALFALISTYFYIRYREENNSKQLGHALYFVYLFYALAVLSKEPAVFLPFVFVVLDIFYFKKNIIRELFRISEFLRYAVFCVIFAVYMGARFLVLGGVGAGLFYTVSPLQRVWVFFDLFGEYLQKLLAPIHLNLFYEFHPTYQLGGIFLLRAFLVLLFISLIIYALRARKPVILFSLTWMFVFLSPALLFINSLGENVFSERYVFASTIGFSFIIGVSLEAFLRRYPRKEFVLLVALMALAAFSARTVLARNALWKSDRILYANTLEENPNADLIRYNLSVELRDEGELVLAKEGFQIVADKGTWRDVYKAYNNLGDLLRQEGKFDEAKEYYNKALARHPQHTEALNNMGALAVDEGDMLLALTYFCRTLRIDPEFPKAKANFERVVGMIDGVTDDAFIFLYQDILHGGAFKPATNTDVIAYKGRDCSYREGCLYTFASHISSTEALLPFLIVGATNDGEAVRMLRTSFQPTTAEISLGIAKTFQNDAVTFFFPTCSNAYYSVTAVPQMVPVK